MAFATTAPSRASPAGQSAAAIQAAVVDPGAGLRDPHGSCDILIMRIREPEYVGSGDDEGHDRFHGKCEDSDACS